MQLSELADIICSKIGKTDDESVAACKDFLRARHAMIVDAYPWKDTLGLFEVDVEAEAQVAILPAEAERPWAVWDTATKMQVPVTSLTSIIALNPGSLSDVGGLMQFVEIESVGWPYPMATNGSQLSFINSGSSEIRISISGERNLNFVALPTLPDITNTEVLSVSPGGNQTSSTWKVIHSMTKPSGGDVLVAQLGTSPEKTWAWPADSTFAKFARLRLIQPPSEAVTLGVLAKRKLRQMLLDTDGPMVRGIDNALLAFGQADMLERSRQYGKAQAKISEGTALLDGARDLERNQSARESRIIPVVYRDEGEDTCRW